MTSATTAARTAGIHHVGLTVPDVTAPALCAIPGGIRLELIAPSSR